MGADHCTVPDSHHSQADFYIFLKSILMIGYEHWEGDTTPLDKVSVPWRTRVAPKAATVALAPAHVLL